MAVTLAVTVVVVVVAVVVVISSSDSGSASRMRMLMMMMIMMMTMMMMMMTMIMARSMMVMMIALRRRVSFLEMSVMNDQGGGGLYLSFAFLQHKLCKLCLLRISMSIVLTILTFPHLFSPQPGAEIRRKFEMQMSLLSNT